MAAGTSELDAPRPATWLATWGPVWAMMAIIFCASTNLGRTENSSRLIDPIIRFFYPEIGAAALAHIVFAVRKVGHISEYALLAGLIWRALRKSCGKIPDQWSRRIACKAVVLAALYAITDELHQSFNPNRMGQWQDVVLDAFGAALGIAVVWIGWRWRVRRRLLARRD
jgi:VanZ family protein